jgi:hypothetical protein
MEIRNAQTLCRPGTIVFAVLAGVLILNLQPEAVSEEFVETAWHQVSCRGGFVRVGVDVSATMADSAVLCREKSGSERISRASRKTSIPAIKTRHQCDRDDHTIKLSGSRRVVRC